jgi:hypothetical protein
MVRVVRWLLALAFLASVATMVALRSPADETVIEGGRYYTRYKQLRNEITRDQYEQNESMMWRNRASSRAAVSMFLSLFALVGLESLKRPIRGHPGGSRFARRRLYVIRGPRR